jgi:hypothetical protein
MTTSINGMARMEPDEAPPADWDDPIVREVREARERIFATFDYDLDAYVRYLRELQEEARRRGGTIISSPESVQSRSDAA